MFPRPRHDAAPSQALRPSRSALADPEAVAAPLAKGQPEIGGSRSFTTVKDRIQSTWSITNLCLMRHGDFLRVAKYTHNMHVPRRKEATTFQCLVRITTSNPPLSRSATRCHAKTGDRLGHPCDDKLRLPIAYRIKAGGRSAVEHRVQLFRMDVPGSVPRASLERQVLRLPADNRDGITITDWNGIFFCADRRLHFVDHLFRNRRQGSR